jgi:hypothetical protein
MLAVDQLHSPDLPARFGSRMDSARLLSLDPCFRHQNLRSREPRTRLGAMPQDSCHPFLEDGQGFLRKPDPSISSCGSPPAAGVWMAMRPLFPQQDRCPAGRQADRPAPMLPISLPRQRLQALRSIIEALKVHPA